MIDVGDGDCFIIQYYPKEDENYYLILVDSGYEKYGASILNHLNTFYPNHAIDLAIITHEDADHYGGLNYLLKHLIQGNPNAVQVRNIIANGLNLSLCDYGNLRNLVEELKSKKFHIAVHNSYDHITLPINQYKTVIKFLSPDKEMFESMDWSSLNDDLFEMDGPIYSLPSPKTSIDDESDDYSEINGSSIVFLFLPDGPLGNKFLFTGDANRRALNTVMEKYSDEISNCKWLKVPHHGSVHNLTTDLIGKINPELAYISTAKPEDAEDIIAVLKNNGTLVFSTHKYGTLLHRCNTPSREDWSPVNPL